MKSFNLFSILSSVALFLFSHLCCLAQDKAKNGEARILVNIKDSSKGDTLHLMLFDVMYDDFHDLNQPYKEYLAVNNGSGQFAFDIKLKKGPQYFSIYKDRILDRNISESYVSVCRRYIVEPSDLLNIMITWDSLYHASDHLVNWGGHGKVPEIVFHPNLKYLKQYKFSFSGNSPSKYKLKYALDKLRDTLYEKLAIDKDGRVMDSNTIPVGLQIIDSYRTGISSEIFEWIKADFIGERESNRLKLAGMRIPMRSQIITQADIFKFSATTMSKSCDFPIFITDKYKTIYLPDNDKQQNGPYFHLKKDFASGEFRDKLMYVYISKNIYHLPELVLSDARNTITSSFYIKQISILSDSLSPGNKAYNFALTDGSGKKIKLSDFTGKIVFLDFWFTGCSACKGYFQTMVSKAEEKFKNDTNIVFVTIAIDRVRTQWLASVQSGTYTSDRAVNLYTEGMASKNPAITGYGVQGYPRPVLIDRNGEIITTKDSLLYSGGLDIFLTTLKEAINRP